MVILTARRLLAALALLVAAATISSSPAAAETIARPNPALVGVQLEYTHELRDPSGKVAALEPLDPAVTAAAVSDQARLAFQRADDLGGFHPAPVGDSALSSGGRAVVGTTVAPQIPHLAAAAGGKVNSFAAVGDEAPSTTPDNGSQPVPGVGKPTPSTTPGNDDNVPPANQGFGGVPTPAKPGTTTGAATTTTGAATTTGTTTAATTTTRAPTTTTRTTTPTTTTTVPTTSSTTTATTTTTAATTTDAGGGGGGSPGGGGGGSTGGTCGTPGLSITSDHSTCSLYAVNMAPGGAASEVLTLRNETDAPFTLSLKAVGTQNRLWNQLRLGVWEDGTAAPSPLPPLLLWTTQFNDLRTLQPGQAVSYRIVLYLPTTAGNDTQGLAAAVDFVWHAQG